ncbi:MAG: hypothetical protein U0R78_09870 [Nocardioidaceae bacterium]
MLGAIGGDFVVVGDDLDAVACAILDRLLGGGGELVTLVEGADGGGLADAAPPTSPSTTRLSMPWCTTEARSATRSSCPSNRGDCSHGELP